MPPVPRLNLMSTTNGHDKISQRETLPEHKRSSLIVASHKVDFTINEINSRMKTTDSDSILRMIV